MAESEGIFDVQVTNDLLDEAVDKVKNLIMTRLRAKNRVVFVLGGSGSWKVSIYIDMYLCVCVYVCVCVCVYVYIYICLYIYI